MAESERLSLEGNSPERDLNDNKRDIRGYEKRRGEMPSLEDILNDDLGDPAEFADYQEYTGSNEQRPRTEDFTPKGTRLYADELPEDAPYVDAPAKPKRRTDNARKYKQSRRVASTADEHRWASIAHGSALLTVITAIFSAGTLSLFTLMIPLAIYFHWRRKSEYVAFQALQAFTLQVLGTVGWMAFLVIGSLLFALLTLLLAITVVGLLLLLILVPLFVILVLASFALPIGMLIFSVIGAMQTNDGKDYRVPKIGRWIDRQMYNGFLSEM
jgi:uncharacterized Tic20 family protein